MKYCNRCIIPDTRPGIVLNTSGVCNACIAHASRKKIDWAKRRLAFCEVVTNAKSRSAGYDCVIPVSGGKDSTWQVKTCLDYGLNPLTFTWKTPARTEVGTKNLNNLISLGVDHIDYEVNPKVERKFLYKALVRYGMTAIPMHMAIFNMTLNVAVKYGIPLVVWGENSAFEYGGTDDECMGFKLDGKWLRRYGVTQGTTAKDWVCEDLNEKELTPYFGPTDAVLEDVGVKAVFLGYYFPWDPENTAKVAMAHGFQARKEGPKVGYYDYADIDDDFISIHHYLKWYKFGFTRLFDNLSLEIRNGRLSREDAIRIVKESGDQLPKEDIDKFCAFIGISKKHFYDIIETFRNASIWKRKGDKWIIGDFLVPDWSWQ